jgi:NADH-quinone oxidoreductase subunit G
MYSIDMLCRRSEPLQQTEQARSAFIGLNPADAARLELEHGAVARVSQGASQAEFEVRVSARVPAGSAWLRSATPATREFGPAVAPVSVEVA